MHQLHLVRTENGHESLTVFLPDGAPVVATDDHPQFAEIVAAAKGDEATAEEIRELADLSVAVANRFDKLTDRVMVANGRIYLDGDEMKSTLTDHILRHVEAGTDFMPLVLFLENLLSNPLEHSREHLYGWLDGRNFQITDDGCVICYKGVDSLPYEGAIADLTDAKGEAVYGSCHHGPGITDGVTNDAGNPVINYVGATVEMRRSETTHAPSRPCAEGLHVGTFSFAQSYGDTRLTVKVNPRDVISVPNEGEKMRVQRYVVLDDNALHPDTQAPLYEAPKVYTNLWGGERMSHRFDGHTEFVANGESRPAQTGEFALYTDGYVDYVFKAEFDHDAGDETILVPKD